MLTYVRTSVLDCDTQTVVNTVNTDGVMGKGIAAAYKRRYPEMYKRYRELCKAGNFKVGQLWLWKENGQWILNFPTKTTWRRPSEVSYIEAGLRKFVDTYEERGITEISFPLLGCGNGGLDWGTQVQPLMERYLNRLPIPVYIHEYEVDLGLPEHKEARKGSYNRSYESFLCSLSKLISEKQGKFHTVAHGSPFCARLVDDALEIRRSETDRRVIRVHADELLALWSLLLKGPVTARSLVGKAHEEAYYVFGVVSSLPFVRPVQVQPSNAVRGAMSIELLDKVNPPQTADDLQATSQPFLSWA